MNNKIVIVVCVVAAFSFGYVANDIAKEVDLSLVSSAQAEVGGMGYRDLIGDRDFKKAVRRIVSRYCEAEGPDISC